MLALYIDETEVFDPRTSEFHFVKKQTIMLEHSLVSISKWESKWHVRFLDENVKKTDAMILDYIRCMTVTPNVDENVYAVLTKDDYKKINDYIQDPMTATTFFNGVEEKNVGKKREKISSELIYYWMIACGIPMECQKWHINRLLTLIEVCNIKNSSPKKSNKKDLATSFASMNRARKHGH